MTKDELEDKIKLVIDNFTDLNKSLVVEDIELVRVFVKGRVPRTTGVLIRFGRKK